MRFSPKSSLRFAPMPKKALLAASASLMALAACGGGGDAASGVSSEAKPTAKAAAKMSAESPIDAAFKLKGGEPLDVDALFTLFPSTVRPEYDSATFDKDLGATIVTNLRFADRDLGDDVEFDGFVIERAELYGVDREAIGQVNNTTLAAIDAPFEKVFTKIRLFGVNGESAAATENEESGEMDEAEGKLTIEAIEFDNLRIRQGGIPEESEGNPLALFVNAFELGGLYMKGAMLGGGSDEAALRFDVPDMRVVGIGGGKIGALIAKDAVYSLEQSPEALEQLGDAIGPQGDVLMNSPLRNLIAPGLQESKFSEFEWRNIDFAGLLPFGLSGEKPPLKKTDMINLGTAVIRDAETLINGKLFSTVPVTELTNAEFTWLAPSNIRTVAEGGTYDFTAYVSEGDEAAADILKTYGLDSVKADSTFDYTWDPKKGGARLSTDFLAPALADVKFAMDFDGVTLKALEAATEEGDENPVQSLAQFKGMSLEIDEENLLDAVFALSAQQSGGDGDTIRRSVPLMMQMASLQLAAVNPRIPDYISALGGFIEKGGKLTITASPETPLHIGELSNQIEGNPQSLPDLLNLEMTLDE
ncbi:MAG: hypothetical protein AAFY84_00120 [Pseudomonadota bacterium]